MTGKAPILKYYKGLDGVRGVAALMIMFFHFMLVYPISLHSSLHLLKKASVIGQTGVPLFFVLSGFLITRILFFSKNYKNYFERFYAKRALRIFPLYYLFLIIVFLIVPAFQHQPTIGWDLTWYYYFYLQNIALTFGWKNADINHLWSLAVEEHFYLLWPVVVYFASYKSLLRIIIGCIIFALLCRLYLISIGIGTFYFTLTSFDSLTIGAFLAINEKHHWLNKKGFSTIFIVTAMILIIAFPFLTGTGLDIVQEVKTPLLSVCYMALIGLIVTSDTWYTRTFSTPFLRYTGKISYGLYIFHPLCYSLIQSWLSPSYFVIDLIIGFASAYVIATISYYVFEIQFLKVKRRFEPTHLIVN